MSPTPTATAWYGFTPTVSGSYQLQSTAYAAAIYTGGSLENLTEVDCGVLVFHATAGTKYYFQMVNQVGQGIISQLFVNVAPDLYVDISAYPSDPSIFDTVQFSAIAYDPAGGNITSYRWDLGDGTTGDVCCLSHRYAVDGDYLVSLRIGSADGRTKSAQRLISVRTHDVAIAKLTVPEAARAGQSRPISVGLKNERYPETVQVELFKGLPSGYYQSVGMLTQPVPVRNANRTTGFDFVYTFTPEDALIGKVTFKAVATIIGYRDAILADNEAVGSPTKVSK
jgi:hypothetical protein